MASLERWKWKTDLSKSAKSAFKITETDKGLNSIVSGLSGLATVAVGVHGEKANKTYPERPGVTVGDVAYWHELGLVPGSPARRWLTGWLEAHQAMIVADAMACMMDVAFNGVGRKKAVQKLANKWAKHMQEWILAGNVTPANAESTAQKKGNSVPMVDTMEFITAIDGKISLPQWKSVPGFSLTGFAQRLAEGML